MLCPDLVIAVMDRVHSAAYVSQVVIMADGQVTQGSEIVKPNVRKVRRIGKDVIGGFAGEGWQASFPSRQRVLFLTGSGRSDLSYAGRNLCTQRL